MIKRIIAKFPVVLTVLCTVFLCIACANQFQKPQGEVLKSAQAAEVAPAVESAKTVTAAVTNTASQPTVQASGVELYKDEPRMLKPVECGSCHKREYERLKHSNSKHRFDCLKCHTKLHAYIPPKNNYAEIMPKCVRCHGLKHGKAFPKCLQCHQDPHSPKDIPFSAVSRKIKTKSGKAVVACKLCHPSIAAQMAKYPCKHNTEVGCTGCHSEKHGYKPSCLDCHDPHVEGQTYKDCLVCHNPHSAKHILKYPEDTSNKVCGSCHTGIYDDLLKNHTKHSDLHCAYCHVRHGQIPRCQKCHGEPHGAALHKRFPNCLQCHIDPHNLPVLKNPILIKK